MIDLSEGSQPHFRSEGITGLRPLVGFAGGVVLSVGPGHTSDVLDRVVEVAKTVLPPRQ
ncbi:hypothetical protein BH23ACT5_BH23ACT5_00350 [soil metagenome]